MSSIEKNIDFKFKRQFFKNVHFALLDGKIENFIVRVFLV